MAVENAIEVGINELTHPNPRIRARMQEHSISDCQYGCKYYQDPLTKITVLRHHATYGCRRTKAVIRRETDPFEGTNHWMIPIGERFTSREKTNLHIRSGVNAVSKGMQPVVESFSKLGEAARGMIKTMNEGFMTKEELQEAMGFSPRGDMADAE